MFGRKKKGALDAPLKNKLTFDVPRDESKSEWQQRLSGEMLTDVGFL